MGIPVESQLAKINDSLASIDQVLIPSTINNMINTRYIMEKEREIITVLQEAEPAALNFLVTRVKLGLLFYKVKDHRSISGQHRTELVELLAVNRISVLNVVSRATVLDALQMMKMTANSRCESWVRNLILRTTQDDLSELKTLTDAKGDYFSMHKLIYDDIRTDSVKEDIINHFAREANVLEAHMRIKTKKSRKRMEKAWRKILSDVDDTLLCSAGHYPAGIDKRFGKKVLYPGVLSFYRELDLGTRGPESWPEGSVGNLVFLSARPHVYKDTTEKQNYAKFFKLRERGMHTNPSLLAGDMKAGSALVLQNDMEPTAQKKFQNFKEYVSIYPEFSHVFIGDNGQGDVRGGELMHLHFPKHLERLYIHKVQPLELTHGYDAERYRQIGLEPCFFTNYVEAAIDATRQGLIRKSGLRRICLDAVKDFHSIGRKQWPSKSCMVERRSELNQSIWEANRFLVKHNYKSCPLILSSPRFNINEHVTTMFGNGWVRSYDPVFDLYRVELDWRPLNEQVDDYRAESQTTSVLDLSIASNSTATTAAAANLKTVVEEVQEQDKAADDEVAAVSNSTVSGSGVGEGGQPSVRDMVSVRSGMSTPPSSIAFNDGASSVADSDRDFFKSVIDEAGMDRHLKTFLQNEAAKAEAYDDVGSPNLSSRLSPAASSAFSPASAVTPAAQRLRSTSPMPELSLANEVNEPNENESINTSNDRTDRKVKEITFAYLKSNLLEKFKPPVLYPDNEDSNDDPVVTRDKSRSIFNFWGGSASPQVGLAAGEASTKVGSYVKCIYGEGRVCAVREDGFVEVSMTNWKAKAYLKGTDVDVVERPTIGLFGLFGGGVKKEEEEDKKDEVFVVGDRVETPYGSGTVVLVEMRMEEGDNSGREAEDGGDATAIRPEEDGSDPAQNKVGTNKAAEDDATDSNGKADTSDDADPGKSHSNIMVKIEDGVDNATSSGPNAKCEPSPAVAAFSAESETGESVTYLKVEFEGWSGTMWCVESEAVKWKKLKSGGGGGFWGSLLAPLGNPFSRSFRKTMFQEEGGESVLEVQQVWRVGSAVKVGCFGKGLVRGFRPIDGMYKVVLEWGAIGWFQGATLDVWKVCDLGTPVLTNLGITGRLLEVQHGTSVHKVSVDGAGLVCYLQPSSIIKPLKACVGDAVVTWFGEGDVVKYRTGTELVGREFVVKMSWGAVLYCGEDGFEVLDEEGRESVVGVMGGWLSYFWTRRTEDTDLKTRRRSRTLSITKRSEAFAAVDKE